MKRFLMTVAVLVLALGFAAPSLAQHRAQPAAPRVTPRTHTLPRTNHPPARTHVPPRFHPTPRTHVTPRPQPVRPVHPIRPVVHPRPVIVSTVIVPNLPVIVPDVPPVVIDVQEVVWAGSENLPGYGQLVFRFRGASGVLMQDAQGRAVGAWSQEGNVVTLTFGGVVYRGAMNGTVLSGTASNGRTQWAWSVQRQG